LPALIQATKTKQRAANTGFDWTEVEPVVSKIHEELQEIQEAWDDGDPDHTEDEIGDLLFAVVNLARHAHVDAETALRRTSVKFSKRFQYIEEQLEQSNRVMEDTELDELDLIWDEAKRAGNI
jgi:ATP diphosphatase